LILNSQPWRLINSGPGSGAWNMAVDEAILEAVIRGEAPPTLRFYSWQPPAITLGHFQRPEKALNLKACRIKGLEVARRPTGGRAILHDKEITFSIITPLRMLGTNGVMDSYRLLSQGIIAGLHRLGIQSELVERSGRSDCRAGPPRPAVVSFPAGAASFAEASEPKGTPALQHSCDDIGTTKAVSPAACFAVKARCDLVVGDRKIVGSAQVHRDGVVLQQNSLPFVIEADEWKEVFQGFNGVGGEAIGLREAAGRTIEFEEAAEALIQGFQEALGTALSLGELTEAEARRAGELAVSHMIPISGSEEQNGAGN
jgi:lipoate-protein ligase A